MNSKKLGIALVTGLALLLVGCGNQTSTSKDASSASSSGLLAPKTNSKISQGNLTPQQTVAVSTATIGQRLLSPASRTACR